MTPGGSRALKRIRASTPPEEPAGVATRSTKRNMITSQEVENNREIPQYQAEIHPQSPVRDWSYQGAEQSGDGLPQSEEHTQLGAQGKLHPR